MAAAGLGLSVAMTAAHLAGQTAGPETPRPEVPRTTSAASAAAVDAGQELRLLLGELRRARATELAALRAAIAADEAKEPGVDIGLVLRDFLEYDPALAVQRLRPATIRVRLQRRGGRWLPGSATGWTESDHQADASDLTWSQGKLAGTLRLRFDPRGERTQGIFGRPLNYDMIPTQTAPFTRETVLELRPSGEGKLAGTHRREAQGELSEMWDEITAEVRLVPVPNLPELPSQAGADGELAALWRQLAGMEWMRVNAGWWDEAVPHLPELAPVAGDAAGLAVLSELGARARAALADRAARPVPDHLIGPGGCEDPDFGPWFADEALPIGTRADGVLPDDLGGAGPQEWRYIGRWHVMLALPGGLDLRGRAGSLQPILADPRLAMRDADGNQHAWRTIGPPSRKDVLGALHREGERVAPPWIDPLQDDRDLKGPPSFLAAADVESPRACTLWLGTGMFVHHALQRLYLNERLIWESARVDEPGNIRGALVRIKLRAGINRLLVHGAASRYNRRLNPFLVAFCTRGAPRDAAQVAADHARQRAAVAAAEQSRRHLRGHQTDWRGQHPDADPVRAWDIESGINVVWRRELPEAEAADAANVLVVGKKVLVTGFPHVLTCLDADTGAVLWRRVASRFEFLDPSLVEEAERLRLAAEKAGATPKKDLSEAEKARLQAQVAAWQALLGRMGDLDGNRGKVTRWRFPWFHTPEWAAPVSDGKWVWVKFGTGVAACYDLDGNRRWMVRTGNPIVGERCSPVLADGLLVLMLPRRHDAEGKYIRDLRYRNAGSDLIIDGDPRNYELVALDAATGKERWRTPVWAGGNEGSPIVAHAANADEVMAVLVTPLGTVVRAADGKVLTVRPGPCGQSYQIPYWDGARLCWTMKYSSVVSGRLVMRDRDHVAIAPSWLSFNNGLTQMQQCGVYTIAYDKRICVMNARMGVNNALGPQEAAIMDVETGALVHRICFVFRSAGMTYTHHVAARDVVIFGQYEKVSAQPPPFYNWAVCSQGDRPRVLALNSTPLTKAGPVCVGDRIYLRCKREVICLGRVGAQGAAYERRTQARRLLTVTIPPRPRRYEQDSVAIAAETAPIPDGVPIWTVSVRSAPGRWLFAGPFPAGKSPFPDPSAARLVPGQKLIGATVERQVVELDPKLARAEQKTMFWRGAMGYVESNAIDIVNATGRTPHSLAYYYTVLRVTRPCVVRLAVKGGSYAESWLSGHRIGRDDGLYRLEPGHYPWLIAITMGPIPPVPKICMRPSLCQVPEWTRAMEIWREEAAAFRPELVRITADDPTSAEAAAARVLLGQIEPEKHP